MNGTGSTVQSRGSSALPGTLQQYAGRLHRAHAGKRVVQIYDYFDEQVPVLARMYRKRLRGYRAMGYVAGNLDAPATK